MIRLSVEAPLGSKERAFPEWSMLTDAPGTVTGRVELQDCATKIRSGGNVMKSHSGRTMSAQVATNWFFSLYRARRNEEGCASHRERASDYERRSKNILGRWFAERSSSSHTIHVLCADTAVYRGLGECLSTGAD
jgi:hypothetical protein